MQRYQVLRGNGSFGFRIEEGTEDSLYRKAGGGRKPAYGKYSYMSDGGIQPLLFGIHSRQSTGHYYLVAIDFLLQTSHFPLQNISSIKAL
ncbi:MAG TPA: hypothetical protein VK014_10065 [Cyclobacteriaceae bacterium]|nr:hypothetical protein [Cyclobacteriaceae bacterium]